MVNRDPVQSVGRGRRVNTYNNPVGLPGTPGLVGLDMATDYEWYQERPGP